MRLKTPALLTGPYDWDPSVLPLHEFETRLKNVHQAIADHEVDALVVHGNSAEYGALAYLTNFVPKLGPAFALIPQTGSFRLLVSGSPTMLSAAKRLTWVEDVRPVGDLKTSIAAWLDELNVRNSKIAFWGCGNMALRPYHAIKAALETRAEIVDLRAPLESLRLRKSAIEVDLCRHSCRILQKAIAAMCSAFHSGSGARSGALAAEQSAYRAGAQDARAYVSARSGGPPSFIDTSDDPFVDPLLANIAVRFAGYWAEGFLTLTKSNSSALARAQSGLQEMLENIRAGMTFGELAALAEKKVSPFKLHPLVENSIGNSIGLSIEEPCEVRQEKSTAIQRGGIYTVRCGASGEDADNAIVSAMVSASETETQILWSALDNLVVSSS